MSGPVAVMSRRVLLRELPAASRPLTAAAAACVVVDAVHPIAFAVATGAAVAAVPGAVAEGFASPAGRHLLTAVAVVGALLALHQALAPVRDAVTAMLARRVQGRTYRRSMVASLTPRTIAHLEDPELLDLVAAATLLSPGGPSGAVRNVLNQSRRYIGGAAALLLVAHFQWWLAIALFVAEVVLLKHHRAVYSEMVSFRARHLPGLRRSVYLRGLVMNPGAAKETRIFGLGDWVIERFRDTWLDTMASLWRQRRGSFRRLAVASVPVFALQLVAVWLMGRAAIDGSIGVGAMVAYAQALMTSMQMCMPGDDIAIEEGAAVVRKTVELESVVVADERLHLSGGTAPPEGAPREEIRLEQVRFRYPSRDDDVLRDLDLVIPAGRSLAIVGDNGAGKTTLVKLLARFYDPTAGRISVDGVDLRELDPTAWQGRVAAVFQDFVRYPLTAAENIGFGAARNGAHEAAASRADALALVEGLPAGWDTVLTREFEGGVDLSGGEWQRLALARALFAAAATGGGLLILDEPTAHLDARAEASFIDGFLEVTRGCTTIVISHRFSTVRRADHIVVLDGGRVTEAGSHDGLVAAGGRYAAMFALQAERFADA